MGLEEFSGLQSKVLWGAFLVSLVFGVVAQKTHFCIMGAISDVVNMGEWTRMRMWGMAVGVAVLGFHALAWWGLIDAGKTFYTSGRVIWLSALTGGLFFGFGMVLASGCGSKTLVRIGAGSLKSLVVFVVMGFSAFATLRGVFAVARVNTVDTVAFNMGHSSALPQWLAGVLGHEGPGLAAALAITVGFGLVAWAAAGRGFLNFDHVLAGVGIGGTVVAMWWVTGHLGFVPEHPETLDAVFVRTNSGVMESLTFTAPFAYTLDWLIYFSDTSKVLTVGVVSVAGVVVGSLLYATATSTFKWEGFRDTQDTALHLIGAVLMGIGGVTAMGCTVGQGLSGLSVLSVTSLVAVVGIVLGGLGGVRFQTWLVLRE